jgi:putative ABC transport system ATP-binding protein
MTTHDPVAASHADAVVFVVDGRIVGRLIGAGPDEVADALTGFATRRSVA